MSKSRMVDNSKSKANNTRKIVEEFVYCLFRGEVMMPVLHYLPPSPPSRAVLLLGRMLNVEFELKQVNLMEGEHLKPEFLQVYNSFFKQTIKILKKFLFKL